MVVGVAGVWVGEQMGSRRHGWRSVGGQMKLPGATMVSSYLWCTSCSAGADNVTTVVHKAFLPFAQLQAPREKHLSPRIPKKRLLVGLELQVCQRQSNFHQNMRHRVSL